MKKYGSPIEWADDVPDPEYIETDRQANELLDYLLFKIHQDKEELIGFDTETHGKKLPFAVGNNQPLDWMSDTVLFWSLSCKVDGQYRRWCLQQQHLQAFTPFLENPDAWLVAWNAKYDAHVCWNSGVNLWNANLVDGLVLNGLYDENRLSNSLKDCAQDYCGLSMTSFLNLFGEKDELGKRLKEFETNLLTLPVDKVSDYASYDAYACLKASEFLIDRLKASPIDKEGHNLWDYYLYFEKSFTEVLWRMERRGLGLDIVYLQSKIPIVEEEIKNLQNDINRTLGQPVNVKSPQQLAKLFFGKPEEGGLGLKAVKMTKGGTKGPQPSVDAEVLELLVEQGNDLAVKVARTRILNKVLSTYLTTLIDLATYYPDHRLHPNFHQMGARTGRLSTTVPNSQNLPSVNTDELKIRMAFVPRPGYKFIVGDYEQVEMRIMAHMSNDPSMKKAINNGQDLHSYTVNKMHPQFPYEEIVAAKKAKEPYTERQLLLRNLRSDYKSVGFGILYGAGGPKIATVLTISDEEIDAQLNGMNARALSKAIKKVCKRNPLLSEEKATIFAAREALANDKIQGYFRAFPWVKSYMDETIATCSSRQFMLDPFGIPTDEANYEKVEDSFVYQRPYGFVQTLLGRYRRLENINSPIQELRGHAEREAINTTIQGTASEIIKAAMVRIEFCPELQELGAEIINQVHDELVIEVLEENAEAAFPLIKECMEHPFEKGKDPISVPTPVDLKIVSSWGLAKG